MIAVASECLEPDTATWQEGFLEMLPMIEEQANNAFRHLKPEAKEDAVSEVVANAMCAYQRLHERGELQRAFASALARYAIAQYRDGRRVGTPQCARDVYSPRAKRRAGFELISLGSSGKQKEEWRESLTDNRQTPVPKQVAFRIDFPRWLANQCHRNRRIAERLMKGYTTSEVADEFDLSPARVSQLRRELADSWYAFIKAVVPIGSE